MGQFSWKYSDTERAMLDGKEHDSYLLVPLPFQNKYGKVIKETCYDGYGMMGGYDVYDLVLEWNKEYIPSIITRNWYREPEKADIINLLKYYNGEQTNCELRWLGIVIACYDEDNATLPFPIKIVENEYLNYNSVKPSEADPNQGWGEDDDEWEEEGEW